MRLTLGGTTAQGFAKGAGMAGTKKRIAGRDDFFKMEALPFEEVPVPEFGKGMVARVKALDGLRGHLVSVLTADKGEKFYRAAMVAGCVVDENDEPVFTQDDIEKLAELDWELIRRLSNAAFRVNRLRQVDQDQAAENLGTAQD